VTRPDLQALQQAIGRAIRSHRERAGMTQAALAEAIGLTSQYVSMLERGDGAPSLEALAKIAGALDMPVRGLFPGEGEASDASIAAIVALLASLSPEDRLRAHRALSGFFGPI
jgi:transcriptional regulator with XRE-family HTH domain